MLKKISFVCAILLGSSLALGQDQSIEVRGGTSMPLEQSFKDFLDSSSGLDLETETSAVLSLAYQQRFSEAFLWGAELQYSSPASLAASTTNGGTTAEAKSKLSTMRAFANLLASKNVNNLSPFVGFGLGLANVTLDDFTISANSITIAKVSGASTMNFAFQFFGGLNFNITDKLYTGFSFRFCNVGEGKLSRKGTLLGKEIGGTKTPSTNNDVKFSEFSLALGFML